MKKINVIVKDKNTLILEENASKGDYIDLSSLSSIDFSTIEEAINNGKDIHYNKKLEEFSRVKDLELEQELLLLKEQYQAKINELNITIDKIKTDSEVSMKLAKANLDSYYNERIIELNNIIKNNDLLKKQELTELELAKNNELSELQNKYNLLASNYKSDLENAKLALNQAHTNEINKLNLELESLKNKNDLNIANIKLENEKHIQNLKNEYVSKLNDMDKLIQEKDSKYLLLQRQKASLNVKQTGEDLESWCNNEVISYMQNGLLNCSWIKDNKVIKDEGETKGSKADYIFNIYASNKKLDNELLTSICLEMKDENPDSLNKKKNADYYQALDKNRNKKNCKYAILVSNLETDKPNDLPIYKVVEYQDMYVVRPAYMMTILNLFVSLSNKFAEIILADNEKKLELKTSIEFLEQFEALKKTYLDNSLDKLKKDLEALKKNNEAIMNASKKIDDLCDSITRTYINQIEDKISKFDVKINREYKKYEKVVISN